MAKQRIIVTDGAYVVEGGIPLYQDVIAENDDGSRLEYRRVKEVDTGTGSYLLCRCGRSSTKPFCDYRHMTEPPVFEGPEVASRLPYAERSTAFEGNGLIMRDDGRCAFARLCHFNDKSVWDMSTESEGELKHEQARAAWHCPSGRLEVEDAETGELYEQEFEPSIIVIEDAGIECSGPLFVRGGVELVGQDGYVYEARNRYALCRCGKSKNMPFCDATHHHEEAFENACAFNDECVPSMEECRTNVDATLNYDESFERSPFGR